MNQTTNLVQYKNLTDDQKATFDFEGYAYEFQLDDKGWKDLLVIGKESFIYKGSLKSVSGHPYNNTVYRLKIDPEKWYFWEAIGLSGVTMGKDLNNPNLEGIIRPAKPVRGGGMINKKKRIDCNCHLHKGQKHEVAAAVAPQGFIAVLSDHYEGSCDGCHFKEDFADCKKRKCCAWERKDKRHVIFVKAQS